MMLVEIRLKPLDLLRYMADMRVWLDRNGVDAAGFSYSEQNDGAIARLAFTARTEAEAFAARFAGRIIIDMAPSPVQIAPPPRAPPWTAATPPERLPQVPPHEMRSSRHKRARSPAALLLVP